MKSYMYIWARQAGALAMSPVPILKPVHAGSVRRCKVRHGAVRFPLHTRHHQEPTLGLRRTLGCSAARKAARPKR